MEIINMTNEEYKQLSIKEFTEVAGRYEGNHAGDRKSVGRERVF